MTTNEDRKSLAFVVANNRGKKYLKEEDFRRELSYKKDVIDPDEIGNYISHLKSEGLLKKTKNGYVPTFNTSTVIVPLDFQKKPMEIKGTEKHNNIGSGIQLDCENIGGTWVGSTVYFNRRGISVYRKPYCRFPSGYRKK